MLHFHQHKGGRSEKRCWSVKINPPSFPPSFSLLNPSFPPCPFSPLPFSLPLLLPPFSPLLPPSFLPFSLSFPSPPSLLPSPSLPPSFPPLSFFYTEQKVYKKSFQDKMKDIKYFVRLTEKLEEETIYGRILAARYERLSSVMEAVKGPSCILQ